MTTNSTHKALIKRKTQRAFAELLSYAVLYNPKTVYHKDGGFSAHYIYVSPDVDSSTDDMLDHNAATWQKAIGALEDGWMIETNLISDESQIYAPTQLYPDAVSALIDDERRVAFESEGRHYNSTCYLSLTYVPPSVIAKKLAGYVLDKGEREKAGENSPITKEYQFFERKVSEFLSQLVHLKTIERLENDKLITFLHRCITGSKHKLKAPDCGYFLDCYLSSQDFLGGFLPKMGDKYVQVVSLDDLPVATYPTILDALNYWNIEYRWSSRVITLSASAASKIIQRLRTKWSSKAIGIMGVIKQSAGLNSRLDDASMEKVQQAEDAIFESNSGRVRHGYMTSVIVLMHEDRNTLQDIAKKLADEISKLGWKARIESANNTEGYLGSIPGHGCYNVRKPLVDSFYMSHALPTSSVYQGERFAPCPFYQKNSPALLYTTTKGMRPYYFNSHVSDVGHTMILGPTGAGKSTLIALLGCQFRKYRDSRIVVLDKDYSNRIWLKSLGGQYYDLAKDNAQFAPFAGLADYESGSREYDAEFQFLVKWLSEICELAGVKQTPDAIDAIQVALQALSRADKSNLNLSLLSPQDRDIRQAIVNFNGPVVSKLLGGSIDSIGNSDVIGFAMDGLLKLDEKIYIPIVRAIFHRLTKLFADRRPTLLVLEEAWSFLKFPIFENMLEDWLLTLRKFNVAVYFVTQNLSHVVDSKISGTIKESCATSIYLPNSKMGDPSVAQKYLHFGLNPQQVAIIGNAMPKQEYYVTSVKGNRLIDLNLGPLTLAFIGVSNDKDIVKFDEIFNPDDSAWVLDWLDYKATKVPGLKEWRDYAKRQYFS